jgi:ABC-type phosphate/phosphonate transport system ATPase subunit
MNAFDSTKYLYGVIDSLRHVVSLQTESLSLFQKIYLSVIIVSAIISSISLIVIISSKNQGKASLLHQVRNSIDGAKTHVEQLKFEIAPLKSKTSRTPDEENCFIEYQLIEKSSVEKLLNTYEDGCQKYFAGTILKRQFEKTYKNDIRRYVEAFSDKFSEPLTEYIHMVKLYKKWHKAN